MTSKTYEITPDTSLMRKSGETNYNIPQAIGELIDNPIDEREMGKRLTIKVKIGQKDGEKYFSITDDAPGMTADGLAEAMTIARSNKSDDQIGEFGLGLKAATAFLGKHVEIVTCRAEEKTAHRLVVDEDEFTAGGVWAIEIHEVEKPFDHGTRIVVTDMKVNLYAGLKNTVLSASGKTFRHFLANEPIVIQVNGTEAEPFVHETLKEYDTELDLQVGDRRVRGWASLAPHGSGRGQYGFDLVRHNRVMSEYEKIGFNASASYTRLVGELHLDDFPVTNNKTAFRVDTNDWNELNRQVEEAIADLKRESRRLANPGRDLSQKDKAEVDEFAGRVEEGIKDQGLLDDLERRALEADEDREDADEGPVPLYPEGGDATSEPEAEAEADGTSDASRAGSKVMRQRLSRVKTTLRSLRIEHNIMRLGRDSQYKIWHVEGVGDNRVLMVTTNQDHPFFEVIGDGLLLWVKHNLVEAVAEYITEETGTAESMLLMKSDILKHIGRIDLAALDEPSYTEGVEVLGEAS